MPTSTNDKSRKGADAAIGAKMGTDSNRGTYRGINYSVTRTARYSNIIRL